MIPEAASWLILFLPLISFLLIVFVVRQVFGSATMLAGYTAVLAIGASFVLSIWALATVIDAPGHLQDYPSHTWLDIGPLEIKVGILMDSLTAIMLIVVSGVSLMVQLYSLGYMKHDASVARFFAYMSLFTFSMLGLVMADNLILLYVFWELVGLSSYLLIGFWHDRPTAAAAAKKAFIVTRFGDLGFLIAILGVYFTVGSQGFDIQYLNEVAGVDVTGIALTLIALGIFAGAVGKSGQFPLHTWLPDAMEGPTPVSALIHAATMVAAGVFLVARMFPVFEASTAAMNTVAYVGAGTALFAATMGLVMTDIKRVLAYSTVSQLGFMMFALGVGAPAAAMFHLFTHAFFKASAVPGGGEREPRHGHLRHPSDGRAGEVDALDLRHLHHRRAGDCGDTSVLGVLEQGRDTGSGLALRKRGVRPRNNRCFPDLRVHIQAYLHHVPGQLQRRGGAATRGTRAGPARGVAKSDGDSDGDTGGGGLCLRAG